MKFMELIHQEFRYVHWYLSSSIVLLLCYYKCNPYLWGKTVVDQFRERQKKGWVLCKQPGMTEVLDMLDKSIVKQSIPYFGNNSLKIFRQAPQ